MSKVTSAMPGEGFRRIRLWPIVHWRAGKRIKVDRAKTKNYFESLMTVKTKMFLNCSTQWPIL